MEDARSHMAGPVRWERDSWCFPGHNSLQLSFGGRRGGVPLTCNGNVAYDVGEYAIEFAGLAPGSCTNASHRSGLRGQISIFLKPCNKPAAWRPLEG